MSRKVWEVIRMLEEEGWVYVGTRGDHRKFVKMGKERKVVVVAGKRSSDMPEGTYRAILRQAGLKQVKSGDQ